MYGRVEYDNQYRVGKGNHAKDFQDKRWNKADVASTRKPQLANMACWPGWLYFNYKKNKKIKWCNLQINDTCQMLRKRKNEGFYLVIILFILIFLKKTNCIT